MQIDDVVPVDLEGLGGEREGADATPAEVDAKGAVETAPAEVDAKGAIEIAPAEVDVKGAVEAAPAEVLVDAKGAKAAPL